MNNNNIQNILNKLENHEKRIRILEKNTQPAKKTISNEKMSILNTNDLILSIVNKIGNCDENSEIQSEVLDKKKMEGKILLCFFISYKYFKNSWLNTGNVEKITTELGVKIDTRNATNKIKELRRYFESGAVRKKGQPTPYRLNRQGTKRFEEIIHDKKK